MLSKCQTDEIKKVSQCNAILGKEKICNNLSCSFIRLEQMVFPATFQQWNL